MLALLTAAVVRLVPRDARLTIAIVGLLGLAVVVPIDLGLRVVVVPRGGRPGRGAAGGLRRRYLPRRPLCPSPPPDRSALAGHAAVLSLWRPVTTAATLGGIVLLGSAVVVLARADRRWLAGLGTGAALLAWPGAVATTAAAAGASGPTVLRLAMAAVVVALAAAVAVRRWRQDLIWYAVIAVVLATAVTVLIADFGITGELAEIYGAIGLIVGIGAGPCCRGRTPGPQRVTMPIGFVGIPATGAWLASLWAVYAQPWLWLGAAWTGAPTGVGYVPRAGWCSTISGPRSRWDPTGWYPVLVCSCSRPPRRASSCSLLSCSRWPSRGALANVRSAWAEPGGAGTGGVAHPVGRARGGRGRRLRWRRWRFRSSRRSSARAGPWYPRWVLSSAWPRSRSWPCAPRGSR